MRSKTHFAEKNNYKLVFWLLLFPLIIVSGCNSKTELKNHTNFTIPPEFEIIEHDKSSGEILAVKYKNEMQIIVSEEMSKIIKKTALYGSALMKQSFEIKFPMLVEKYQGSNISKQDHYYVNKNIYLHRYFDYEIDGHPGYYEYGALHIEKPEEYFEFFISGDKSKKEKHKALIKSFLKGVK